MGLHPVPLTVEHRVAAGALLAARHVRERQRYPLLPAAPEDPAVGADLVAGVLAFCDGVAALDDRRELVGFLTTFEQIPDPSSPAARYSPERSFVHLVHGHAVAHRVDPSPVYAAMFGVLAERAVGRGVVDFVAHVPIGDPAPEAAWAALGFGRVNAVAVRDLAPTRRALPSGVEVRQATDADLDVVECLIDEESVFHAGSPIFRPYLGEQTAHAVRAQLAKDLASDDHAFFVARSGGHDVGVLSISAGLGSPLYVPDGAAYIAATAVLPDARRSGIGAALAEAAFDWARRCGYRAACLHFATANVTSTTFWTGIGFTPVMAHLRRRIDDRVLTAQRRGG